MKEVKKIIAEYTGFDYNLIRDDMKLKEDLDMDSLSRMEVAIACETIFEIEEIPEEELMAVETVKDISDLVNKYTLSI